MHRLIYASRPSVGVDRDDLRDILVTSRAHNQAIGITGRLLYSDEVFVQVLEGVESAVRDTFGRIAVDRRHTRVGVLVDEAVPDRRFGEWSMGFALIDDLPGRVAEGDPGELTRGAAEALLDLGAPPPDDDDRSHA